MSTDPRTIYNEAVYKLQKSNKFSFSKLFGDNNDNIDEIIVLFDRAANLFRAKKDHENALICYRQIISIREKQKLEPDHRLFKILENGANSLLELGKREEAIKWLIDCKNYLVEKDNFDKAGDVNTNIGKLLFEVNKYDEAIKFLLEAKEYYQLKSTPSY